MQQHDAADFKRLLGDVMAFYRQDLSTFALSVWWEACLPFSLEQVRKALTQHAMNPDRGQFAPKPADLVRELAGTHTDRSLIAWGRVQRAIQAVGAYGDADFRDPAIHAAITDMGGWPAICRAPVAELQFWQKRFCDAYRAYSQRGTVDAPMRLAGEHSIANTAAGYLAAPGVVERIAHVADALAIENGGAA